MQRVLSGLILAALTLVVVWYAPPRATFAMAVLAALLAGRECGRLLCAAGWARSEWECGFDALLIALAFGGGAGYLPGLVVTLVALRIFGRALLTDVPKTALAGAGVSLAAALWIGAPAGMFAVLHRGFVGRDMILFLLVVVWANDIAAYYAGRRFGRRKLAPRISPGKTVEGAIGGLLAGAVAGALLKSGDAALIWKGAALALFIGVFAQAGDLCESLLKRAAGEKDAGTLIPGHGGVLDRIDGLLLAIPPFYYLTLWYVSSVSILSF
ncbi:MAG: phosphatidate cytidylyltransferase [bacterium]|nr:phosphatidate cytidylyltransferase [bacterium]